ncbi:MAG: DUF3298 domain-containing protein [Parabacteroides sp.]
MVGCSNIGSKEQRNDITFDSISVEQTYHLLENPENPNCNLEIKFVYPTHLGDASLLAELQKQFVSTYFGENYESLLPEEAVKRYTDDYIAAYKDLESDFQEDLSKADDRPVGAWYSYYEMSQNEIDFNERGILCYTVSFENYTGGAHGAHAYNHHVIDLKTAKPLTEADIFVENYEEMLAQILVDQIAKQNNVANNKELENIGFFSIDEIFPNGNFRVDETGITYSFNEYEIAAYVVGATHVQLPYKEIRHLLRDDSPISSLID